MNGIMLALALASIPVVSRPTASPKVVSDSTTAPPPFVGALIDTTVTDTTGAK